jgi:hypothetical protein
MNVENINEKTRPRAKKSFHYSSIKDKKYKNRFFKLFYYIINAL